MGKPIKPIYLGPDFETDVRKSNENKLSEVVLRRLFRNSKGFSFGKYLRNIASNKPFSGLDIVIENGLTIDRVLKDLSAHYGHKHIRNGFDKDRNANYSVYNIFNPKTKTNIEVKFWTGASFWAEVKVDADVNGLVRSNDNKIRVHNSISTHRDDLISMIKKGEFTQFIESEEGSKELKLWAKSKTGNGGSRMANVKDMVKKDAIEAGYRVASKQMTKGVKGGILALMKDKGMDDGKLAAIREVLDTEIGDAIVSTFLGYGLTYVPQLKDDPRAVKLAEEFRITGIATAGNLAVNSAMEYVLPVVSSAMASLPAVEASVEEQVRIATEEAEELEMEQEDAPEPKQATA